MFLIFLGLYFAFYYVGPVLFNLYSPILIHEHLDRLLWPQHPRH